MADLPNAKKKLGQHWLSDPLVLEDIASSAEVAPGDVVLEIGPGTGTLTEVLLAFGAEVVALEFDDELISGLEAKFAGKSIRVEAGDIRSYDFASLPEGYKIVANIPYYLTANLFRALIDAGNKPVVASLLVQKEVAERAAAKPGKMSFVAVALQLFYEVDLGGVVPAHLFSPPPKVDSQVLIMKKRPKPLFPGTDYKGYLRLVKAGFSSPRKKLKTTLKTGVDSGVDIEKIMAEANLNPNARAQELSLEGWHKLYQLINS